MLFDDAPLVRDGHLPSSKLNHLAIVLAMPGIERCLLQPSLHLLLLSLRSITILHLLALKIPPTFLRLEWTEILTLFVKNAISDIKALTAALGNRKILYFPSGKFYIF